MDILPGNNPDEWQFLGSSENAIPYQQVTVFNQMRWDDFEVENYNAVCGKCSGPLALYWNTEELAQISGDIRLSTDIFIYDPTGKRLAQISGDDWSNSLIISIGWTLSERLFILLDDGRFYIYSILGERIAELKLFDQPFTDLVANGVATESGCVVYTRTGRFIYIQCDDKPTLIEYPSLAMPSGNIITSLCCIENRYTESGDLCIIAACWNQAVYVINSTEVIELNIQQNVPGRLIKMAVAPNGQYIAGITHEGVITVFNTTFNAKILEFGTQTRIPPKALVWCGEDSIAAYWKGYNLLLLSPFCEYLRYEYDSLDEPLFLVQEMDCLRVISKTKHEIIRSVPPTLYNIFMEGSEAAGALLRRNFNQFAQKTSEMESKEGIGDLTTEQILNGVRDCLNAAINELSTFYQESLLRSVNYGQHFLPKTDQEAIASEIPPVAKTLRILNALRTPNAGFYLTYEQYQFLGEEAVIARLLSRRYYQLGVKLCQFLNIPHDFVLINWACEKIRFTMDLPTPELCDLIHGKLKEYDVSYCQVAWTAYQVGNPELACLLLQYEKKAADRVPVLIMMNQDEKAANEACTIHDQDLIQFVAIQLYTKYVGGRLNRQRFVQIVNAHAPLLQCLSRYVHLEYNHREDEETAFLKDCENYREYAVLSIARAFQTGDLKKRIDFIKPLNTLLTDLVATHKELDSLQKMVAEHIKLLGFQKEIYGKYRDNSIVNMTVEQLMKFSAQKSQLKQVEHIRNVFKISDKKYYDIVIKTLAACDSWELLKIFSSERSPVGYVPFVEVCIEYKRNDQARFFIQKLSDTRERLKYYMQCEIYDFALPDALSLRDVATLTQIAKLSDSDSVRKAAKKSIKQLTNK